MAKTKEGEPKYTRDYIHGASRKQEKMENN